MTGSYIQSKTRFLLLRSSSGLQFEPCANCADMWEYELLLEACLPDYKPDPFACAACKRSHASKPKASPRKPLASKESATPRASATPGVSATPKGSASPAKNQATKHKLVPHSEPYTKQPAETTVWQKQQALIAKLLGSTKLPPRPVPRLEDCKKKPDSKKTSDRQKHLDLGEELAPKRHSYRKNHSDVEKSAGKGHSERKSPARKSHSDRKSLARKKHLERKEQHKRRPQVSLDQAAAPGVISLASTPPVTPSHEPQQENIEPVESVEVRLTRMMSAAGYCTPEGYIPAQQVGLANLLA